MFLTPAVTISACKWFKKSTYTGCKFEVWKCLKRWESYEIYKHTTQIQKQENYPLRKPQLAKKKTLQIHFKTFKRRVTHDYLIN